MATCFLYNSIGEEPTWYQQDGSHGAYYTQGWGNESDS